MKKSVKKKSLLQIARNMNWTHLLVTPPLNPTRPNFLARTLCALVGVLTLLLMAVPAQSATLTYNFNDGTIQGWHNRVWDLSANSGSGGWVNLDPNVTAMPLSINAGEIQPPSADNQLFGNNGTQVDPIGGQNDNHLNTIWLRSPQFSRMAREI